MVMATRKQPADPHLCQRCYKLPKPKRHKFSSQNDAVARDAPEHLAELTAAEAALIALAFQHIQVCRGTGGSEKYHGHVCCFPQQVRAAPPFVAWCCCAACFCRTCRTSRAASLSAQSVGRARRRHRS